MTGRRGRGRGSSGHSRQSSRGAFKPGLETEGHCEAPNDEGWNTELTERWGGRRGRKQSTKPVWQEARRAEAERNGLDMSLNVDIRKYCEQQQSISAAGKDDDWLDMPEIPTINELLLSAGAEVALPANKIHKPFKTPLKYLSTHYKLLREDGASPLRDAIDRFRKTPDMAEDAKLVEIYDKVHIAGFTFSQNGVAARIKFSLNRLTRRVPWSQSKRLISGNIVALSPADDLFSKQCIVAIVAARPLELVERNPPEIDIYFARPTECEIDPQQEFVMVAAKQGYFEAYRHVLRALQKMATESFPLSDHLIGKTSSIEPPKYLETQPLLNLSAAINEQMKSTFSVVDVLHSWPEHVASTLDHSQWNALRQILAKRLSIVQGPPGTGKTHVSKVALEIMMQNRAPADPPIIIAAQTNHALDQLLGHVSVFDPNFIRLGGRSTNVEVKKRALFEIRTKERIPNIAGSKLGSAKMRLNQVQTKFGAVLSLLDDSEEPIAAETFFKLGVINEQQKLSLEEAARGWISRDETGTSAVKHWLHDALVPFEVHYDQPHFAMEEAADDLEVEQVRETEAEHGVTDEEDIEMLFGPWKPVFDKFTVRDCSEYDIERAEVLLDTKQDLWQIEQGLRGAVYLIMQRRAKTKALLRFRELAVEYEKIVEDLKIGKWEKDSVYLKRANFIGLTTTGLSKYRPLIASLRPKIFLIEEAAEVLEGPVAAACVESLEHLILVGDHQQLQGHVSVGELEGEPYNLNVSMFERLIGIKIPFKMLLKQRRMRPEFRELIRTLYQDLEDHPYVLSRPEPEIRWGMGDVNSFFMTHDWAESKDESSSTKNEEEARLVAKFYRHLLRNGVPQDAITILTFYNGQRKEILKQLRQDPETFQTYNNVKTVDSYQGEENDIIILSLVRNSIDGPIGFLSVDNRVCVALSRAKFGFYMFGNATLLRHKSNLWEDTITCLEWSHRLGEKLPTRCARHNKTMLLQYPEDFDSLNGGCDQPCDRTMVCGHGCPKLCHASPCGELIQCMLPCIRTLPCGHRCRLRCYEKCQCDCLDFEAATARLARVRLQDQFTGSLERPVNPVQGNKSRGEDSELHGHRILIDDRTSSRPAHAARPLARGGASFQPLNLSLVLDDRSGRSTSHMDAEGWQQSSTGGAQQDDVRRAAQQASTRSNNVSTAHDLIDLLAQPGQEARHYTTEMGLVPGSRLERFEQAYDYPKPRKNEYSSSSKATQTDRSLLD